MVTTRSGLPPASTSAPNLPEEPTVLPKESSEIPVPKPTTITPGAFEELRQQVATLTQLLSQRSPHPQQEPEPVGGFVTDARARVPHPANDIGGTGTSGINHMASRSITIDPEDLARIIQ